MKTYIVKVQVNVPETAEELLESALPANFLPSAKFFAANKQEAKTHILDTIETALERINMPENRLTSPCDYTVERETIKELND